MFHPCFVRPTWTQHSPLDTQVNPLVTQDVSPICAVLLNLCHNEHTVKAGPTAYTSTTSTIMTLYQIEVPNSFPEFSETSGCWVSL